MECAGAVDLEVAPPQRLEEPPPTSEQVCRRVVEERVAIVGSFRQHRQQCDHSNEVSGGNDGGQGEARGHHRSPLAVPHHVDGADDGDDHHPERAADQQRPDERGNDVAVQEHTAVELEHPLVVLPGDQREGRLTGQQDAWRGNGHHSRESRSVPPAERGWNQARGTQEACGERERDQCVEVDVGRR